MTSFDFEKFLVSELNKLLPKHAVSEGYDWAMFPAGKLFRPKLSLSIVQDLNPKLYQDAINLKNNDPLFFACALECHHSYSLVHDDLPSMDNDDYRRGKLSTHKKFGEWQAILIGDGLLNISYEFLSKLRNAEPKRILELIKIFSWSMGPKGLIHGQYLDLSHEMTLNFSNTILTHKLKTGRLIQMAILGGVFLSIEENRDIECNMWCFGENVGILFQLLDDLSELSEAELSPHEQDVNPWLKDAKTTYSECYRRLIELDQTIDQLKLKNTQQMLGEYFLKMNSVFKTNVETISENIENQVDLHPLVLLLDRISKI